MPIVDQNIIEGPQVQADGEHRGIVEYVLSDGRTVRKQVRAADAVAWSEQILDLAQLVQAESARQDAKAAVDAAKEVLANGEATIQEVALAYLRAAYATGDPYRAYLLFARFNTYRLNQGWTLAQVQTQLATAGLTEAEWTDMRARYTYLSQADRVTAMTAYEAVLAGDTWGAEYR